PATTPYTFHDPLPICPQADEVMKRIPKGSARSFKTRRYLADRRPITRGAGREEGLGGRDLRAAVKGERPEERFAMRGTDKPGSLDRKSTRLNSSHLGI